MNRTIRQIGKSAAAVPAMFLLLATVAQAQNSQFLFDTAGNLMLQTSETSAPPQIIGQPQNQIVVPGELAAFSVLVADTQNVLYQWRFNGVAINGAIAPTILLEHVTAADEGQYSVVLVNGSGSLTSAPARLMLDSRGCGMPDSWQLAYFGNLTNNATGDFDGDGVCNLQEFLDGTDPTNPTSVNYRLTVVNDGGTVNIEPNQLSYAKGQAVTLTASPSEAFHAWTGDALSHSNVITVTMDTNKTILARFTPVIFAWTNLAGGDWDFPTNWIPNLVPGSNDIALVTNAVTITNETIVDAGHVVFGSVVEGPTLTGGGTFTMHGTSVWNRITLSGSGRTVVAPGGELNLASAASVYITSRAFENGGTVRWTGTGPLVLFSGVTITNRPGAIFDAENAVSIGYGSGAASRFDNAGIFRKSTNTATTTVVTGVTFNNYGSIDLQAGTLLFNDLFLNQGDISLSSGTTNRIAAGGSSTGSFYAASNAVVEWFNSAFTLNLGSQLNGSGTYRITGVLTCNTDLLVQNLDLRNQLNGPGTITVGSLMNLGGTLSGPGRTLIAAGATMIASNFGSVLINNRILENAGTVLWTGTGLIALNSGAIMTNRPGALFDVQNSAFLTYQGGAACRLDNAGTFKKSIDLGTTTIGVDFNNFGLIDLQTGTLQNSSGTLLNTGIVNIGPGTLLRCNSVLANNGVVNLSPSATNRLAGGGSASGTFATTFGSVVDFNGGTFNLNPGSQLNGDGVFRISGGGTLSANTDITIQNLDFISNLSALTGSNTVTISKLMNWTAGEMSGTGRTFITSGASLIVSNAISVSIGSRTLENAGTIVDFGSADFVANGGVVTNRAGALFEVQDNAAIRHLLAASRFDNAGTFRKRIAIGTNSFSSSFTFNNYGVVDLQSGLLLFNGPLLNNGAITLSSGTALKVAGGGSASGVVNGSAGSLCEINAGTFTLGPGAQLNGPALYRVTATGTLTANTDLSLQNFDLISNLAVLNGSGIVSVANLFNWTAGTMSGSGRTIIGPAAVLNLSNSVSVSLNNRVLENAGTVIYVGPANLVANATVITNRLGALFDLQNDVTLNYLASACRFDNAGTLRKSLGTGTNAFGNLFAFNNYGTVDLRTGTLAANGGYTSAAGASLNCAIGGVIPGTNFGRLVVPGAVSLNGGLGVSLGNGYLPTTNDSFTLVSAGSRSSTFTSFSFPSNLVTMQLSNTPNAVIAQVTAVAAPPAAPVLLVPSLSGPNIVLTWTAVSNAMYRVEFNSDLAPSNWTTLPGDIIGASNTATKLDLLTPSNRFYRVRVLP